MKCVAVQNSAWNTPVHTSSNCSNLSPMCHLALPCFSNHSIQNSDFDCSYICLVMLTKCEHLVGRPGVCGWLKQCLTNTAAHSSQQYNQSTRDPPTLEWFAQLSSQNIDLECNYNCVCNDHHQVFKPERHVDCVCDQSSLWQTQVYTSVSDIMRAKDILKIWHAFHIYF